MSLASGPLYSQQQLGPWICCWSAQSEYNKYSKLRRPRILPPEKVIVVIPRRPRYKHSSQVRLHTSVFVALQCISKPQQLPTGQFLSPLEFWNHYPAGLGWSTASQSPFLIDSSFWQSLSSLQYSSRTPVQLCPSAQWSLMLHSLPQSLISSCSDLMSHPCCASYLQLSPQHFVQQHSTLPAQLTTQYTQHLLLCNLSHFPQFLSLVLVYSLTADSPNHDPFLSSPSVTVISQRGARHKLQWMACKRSELPPLMMHPSGHNMIDQGGAKTKGKFSHFKQS